MISDEAVEAAARVNYEARAGAKWALLNNYAQARERSWMRAALEAAAPHMLAEAWDEGMEAMYESTSHEWPPIPEANPYRRQG